MDPNAVLAQLQKCASNILERPQDVTDRDYLIDMADVARRLAELFEGLDEWIKRQGFLPKDWATSQDALAAMNQRFQELSSMHSVLCKACVGHQKEKDEAIQARAEIEQKVMAKVEMNISLQDTVRHMAQSAHNAWHRDIPGGWWTCPRDVCTSAQQALPELVTKLKGPLR